MVSLNKNFSIISVMKLSVFTLILFTLKSEVLAQDAPSFNNLGLNANGEIELRLCTEGAECNVISEEELFLEDLSSGAHGSYQTHRGQKSAKRRIRTPLALATAAAVTPQISAAFALSSIITLISASLDKQENLLKNEEFRAAIRNWFSANSELSDEIGKKLSGECRYRWWENKNLQTDFFEFVKKSSSIDGNTSDKTKNDLIYFFNNSQLRQMSLDEDLKSCLPEAIVLYNQYVYNYVHEHKEEFEAAIKAREAQREAQNNQGTINHNWFGDLGSDNPQVIQ